MSEFIVEPNPYPTYKIDGFNVRCDDWLIQHEEIVRCRDCKHYYEVDEYHPNGNYDRRCCKYFDSYDNEVEPDGFCKWGERDA